MKIIGLDEVGRGCLAGPLVVCAVRLDESVVIEGLKDSKKLNKKQKRFYETEVRKRSDDIAITWVSNKYIDEYGLAHGLRRAFNAAFSQISKEESDTIIVDGSVDYINAVRSSALIKADDSIPAVMAASVVAKQARDNFMVRLAKKYPQYGFESHVGYGTAAHIKALQEHGISVVHRRSIKSMNKYASNIGENR